MRALWSEAEERSGLAVNAVGIDEIRPVGGGQTAVRRARSSDRFAAERSKEQSSASKQGDER